MTPRDAARLTPGTVVMYHGSRRRWHGPMAVVSAACDCRWWPHGDEPRLVLAEFAGGPAEVSHVKPGSLTAVGPGEYPELRPDPAELAAWLEMRRR